MKHTREPSRHGAAAAGARRWRQLALALAAASVLAGCDSLPARSNTADAREPAGVTVYGTVDVGVQRQR